MAADRHRNRRNGKGGSLANKVREFVGGLDDLNTAVQAGVVVASAAAGGLGGVAIGLLGPLASARFGKYAANKQQKLADAIHEASQRIDGLRDRIDKEFVRSEEFVGLSFRAHTTNLNSSRDEKIRYIRNFVINSTLDLCSADPDKEFYLHLIDVLTFTQLDYFVAFCRSLTAGDFRRFLTLTEENGNMLSTVAEQLLGTKNDYAKTNQLTEELLIACRVLASYGLLRVIDRNSGQISYHYQTTPLTSRFARFIGDTEDVITLKPGAA
jgi:hypothetical protein